MGKMKNFMMDIEEFCDACYADLDLSVDETIADVGMAFKSIEAQKYAKRYLTEQLGEF